jgi:hypothetical protein
VTNSNCSLGGERGRPDLWTTRARSVQRIAVAAGIELDDEALIAYDLRDLLSLELWLRSGQRGDAPQRLAVVTPDIGASLLQRPAVFARRLLRWVGH